jgi:hypothetical protein
MHISTAPTRRTRALAAAGLLTLATLLGACGGDDDAATDATTPTTPADAPADDASTDGGTTDTTMADDDMAGDDAGSVDLCTEITQADMEAILPEATFTSVAPNEVIAAPSCEYRVDIGGVEAAVVTITLEAEDPGFLESQRQVQTDPVDVPGLTDAFAYDDFGTVLVATDLGVFQIERGVELAPGGAVASPDQMTAIAELVAAR